MFDKSEAFDKNWAGPEELKPLCYRSQLEKDIWNSIAVENEYRLDTLQPNDVVIDIGANIGAFSHLARRMGSRSIYAFEIDSWNYEGALVNLREWLQGHEPDMVLYNVAVVRGDEHRSKEYHYNGAWNSFGVVGPLVQSISLDEILEPHATVRFLKIDVEGCEWPILYTCTKLDRVQEIAGEYHVFNDERNASQEMRDLPYAMSKDALVTFLYNQGFRVEFVENSPTIGNFFAKRRPIPTTVDDAFFGPPDREEKSFERPGLVEYATDENQIIARHLVAQLAQLGYKVTFEPR